MIKWIKNNYKAIIIWVFFELVTVIREMRANEIAK